MSVQETVQTQGNFRLQPRFGSKPGLVDRLARSIFARWQRRRAIAQLESLDDKTLADIGILRSEIPGVIDGITAQRGRTIR